MASLVETRRDQMFPVLGPDQIALASRFTAERERRFAPSDLLFALGVRDVPALLVLQGCVEVVRRDGMGGETVIVRHEPGKSLARSASLPDALRWPKAGLERTVALS